MKQYTVLLYLWLLAAATRAEVRVFVQDTNGVAWLNYECTAAEVVRAFALDVTVNRGQIVRVSDFFRGPSTAEAQGYGIFPAAFRDCIAAGLGTNVNWDASEYTPLAVVEDSPDDTQPGLNSPGATLVFAGLWDSADPAAVPGATGTLCALQISDPATVSVAANLSRGGIVSDNPGIVLNPVLSWAVVGPAITNVTLVGGVITICFKGGELLTAPAPDGPWTGTGNSSGIYSEPVAGRKAKFFRVSSATVAPAITSITLAGGVITIYFKGGELLAAPAPDGPWTGTGNTNGIYTEPVGGNNAKFFRVRGP